MPIPNPIAFTIGNFSVRWYGIIIARAIVVATLVMMKRAPGHNIKRDDLLDILICAVPLGIVGARLYYVIFNWNYYSINPVQIFNLRAGGLAIHGGLILGIIGALVIIKYKGYSFFNVLDLAAPAIALGQAIGRWGNYFNSEAHGGPTDLPWAIIVDGEAVHPTFLYESLWCLILFFILLAVDRKRQFTGQVICLYGILYSIERFFVEALRTDSLMIGPLKQAQVISIVIIVICVILYFILRKRDIGNQQT